MPAGPAISAIPALLRLAIGASLISFSPVFVEVADVGPTISAFYRMVIGGSVLVGMAIAKNGLRRPPLGHVRASALAGALVAIDLAIWHRAIEYVGPGLATILGNLQVFFFAAFGVVVLGEPLRRRTVAAAPLALVGLVLIFGIDSDSMTPSYRVGITFGLLTAVFYAAYLIALRRAKSKFPQVDATTTVAVLTVTAAVLLGISGLIEHESFAIPNRGTFAALVGLGLVPQVLGWVLISEALPQVDTARAGLLLLLQPALAYVWDVLLLGRPLEVIEGTGVLVTLVAIYVGQRE